MKTKLTFVKRTERTSSKTGKPFTSISIKTEAHGDKYLSGFGNSDNASWEAGTEVEIDTSSVNKDGKEYINFTTPKKAVTPQTESRTANLIEFKVIPMLENLDIRLSRLEQKAGVIEVVEPPYDVEAADEMSNQSPF